MSEQTKSKSHFNSGKEILVFLITLAFMFLFRFVPPVEPITPYGMALLGVFLGVIFGWCFGGNNTLWTSLFGLIALGVTLPAGVLGATMQVFSSYVFIIVLLSLFTVGALLGANISEYLVVKLLSLKFLEGHPWRFIVVLFLGAYLLSFMTNPMVIGIFLFSLYETLFTQAGYKPGDKTPTFIIIATAIIALLETINRPWATPQIISLQALENGAGIAVGYAPYMLLIIAFSLIFIALMVLLMRLLNCDVEKLANIDLTELKERYKNGLHPHQKGVLVAILVLAIGSIVVVFFPANLGAVSTFVTAKLSIIGWMLLVISCMLFIRVDGKLLLDPQTLASNFPWHLLMMIGVGVTVGTVVVGEGTGVSEWLGSILGPILGGMNDFTIYIALAFIGIVLTNLLNNNAMAIMLSSTVVGLYLQGFIADPILAIIIVIVSTTFGFITPASSFYGALIHSNKFIDSKSVYKWGLLMAVFCLIVTAVLLVPMSHLFF